jgi:hypothetical protein
MQLDLIASKLPTHYSLILLTPSKPGSTEFAYAQPVQVAWAYLSIVGFKLSIDARKSAISMTEKRIFNTF